MGDPSFQYSYDQEANQTLISGMGELHLDIIVDRMRREFNVKAAVGKPQVAYRETVRKKSTMWYTHKKQSGGSGQYAKVCIEFEPNDGKGFEFINGIIGMAIPKEFMPAIEKGIANAMKNGAVAGYPMV